MHPNLSSSSPSPVPAANVVEGIAKVVKVEAGLVWLEPEQTTSCGSCSASAACGAAGHGESGIGTVARRIEARRFSLENPGGESGLCVGERVVVGVNNASLLKGTAVAYGLPLACMLITGGLFQGAYESDSITLVGMVWGLGVGLIGARLLARKMAVRGELAPRFLRRARPGETCSTV